MDLCGVKVLVQHDDVVARVVIPDRTKMCLKVAPASIASSNWVSSSVVRFGLLGAVAENCPKVT
jgi:hypothetical protein